MGQVRRGTVGKVVEKIHGLGRRGVQFAAFPETVFPHYACFAFVQPAYAISAQHHQVNKPSSYPRPPPMPLVRPASGAIGVNERDGGSLYNTQLLFDADGTLLQHRRASDHNKYVEK